MLLPKQSLGKTKQRKRCHCAYVYRALIYYLVVKYGDLLPRKSSNTNRLNETRNRQKNVFENRYIIIFIIQTSFDITRCYEEGVSSLIGGQIRPGETA